MTDVYISSPMINVLDFKLTRLDALVELQVCGTLVLNSNITDHLSGL